MHIAWCIQYAYETNVGLEAAAEKVVTQTWVTKRRSPLVVNYKDKQPATMEALAASASKMAVALRVVHLAVLGAVTVDGQPPFGAGTDALRLCNMGCTEVYVFLTNGRIDVPSNAYRELYNTYVVENIVSVHKALLAYGPSHTPRAACSPARLLGAKPCAAPVFAGPPSPPPRPALSRSSTCRPCRRIRRDS